MQTHFQFAGYRGKRVHLGVTGSVAAYKGLDLLRALLEAQCSVSATLTESATRFVTPLSFEALGAAPVYTGMFSSNAPTPFGHLEPGQNADVMLIAPASASTMARLAHGLADDMLSCQALAFEGAKLVAPAMNPRMWNGPATRRNWAILNELGFECIEPDSGNVACGDTGSGRLAQLEEIFARTLRALSTHDLAGKRVLITLGPTREPWDAVRFWSNPSSGTMGACMAMAAYLRGAEVTVIAGPTTCEFPSEITVRNVQTAKEMFEASMELWPNMDIGCCTAAVADFAPVPHGHGKFKKQGADTLNVEFTANPDILASLGKTKSAAQKLIGFAAEAGDVTAEATRKLEAKNLDLLAANDITQQGSGFGVPTNSMYVLSRSGRNELWPELPKTEVAWRIWDQLFVD